MSKRILEQLGNPQSGIPFVHIAGTNGKGSTTAFLCKILEQTGKKVGMFTSPHLITFEERIRINGVYISKEDVTRLGNLLLETKFDVSPTMFDYCLAMAVLYFKEQQCDIMVMETGIGGRYDSTNALGVPELAIITKIGFDHTAILGDTLEEIAREKAGIIKNQIPVCIGFQSEEAEKVLINKAKECGAKYYLARELITNCKSKFHKNCTEIYIESPLFARPINTKLKLMGSFQAHNAALAALTLKILFPEMDEAIIEAGLARTHLMGRFEITGNEGR